MKYRITSILSLFVVILSLTSPGWAEEIILEPINKDMIPGREKPVPVSISGFSGEAEEVIRFDLTVQGFTFTSAEEPQYLLSGSANGNLTGRAQDRINKNYLVNKSYSGASVRRQAHQFVDDFLAALGRKGLGATKIAFKRDTGANSEIAIGAYLRILSSIVRSLSAHEVAAGRGGVTGAPELSPAQETRTDERAQRGAERDG